MMPAWIWRLALGALWCAAAVALIQYATTLVEVLRTEIRLGDFRVYLEAAESAVAGETLYLRGYRYPPPLALLLTPMTLLTPVTAQRLWTLIDQVFLAAGLWLSLRWLPRHLSRVEVAILIAITFGFFPLYTQLKLGQMGNIIFLLVAAMAAAWHGGARAWSGAPIALATALKLYPMGFVLWFLHQGAWRTVLVVVVVCTGILLLPDAILGGRWMEDYVRSLPEMFSTGASPIKADNQSFFAFITRWGSALGAATPWQSAGFVVAVTAALIALMLTLACIPRGAMSGDVTAIVVTATFLPLAWANPVSWTHNYVALLLAAPALVQRLAGRLRTFRHRNDMIAAAVALTAWLLMSQPYRLPRVLGYGESNTVPLAMLLRSTFLYGSIVVWGVMLRELRIAARSPHMSSVP